MIHLSLADPLTDEPLSQDLRAFPCVQGQRGDMAALHLPVAPLCNVQCAYCDRSGDCVHQSPRGSASLLLTSNQAVSYALESIRREPRIKCVGVSGPGDPLANSDAVFSTLGQIRIELPEVPFFIATNGLNLATHVQPIG